MMRDLPDGFSVATYMLGKANAAGLSGWHGLHYFRANVRHSGLAYRIPVPSFRHLIKGYPTPAAAISTGMTRMIMQLSQAVVCGKHHSVERQLIRGMPITLALGKLTALGYIRSRRGLIQLIQREAMVCDCN